MSDLHNSIYRFNAIQIKIKIPASYFVDIDKLILKFIWRGRRHSIAYTILKEKNKVGEELQTILQSFSNQDSLVLAQKQKYRSMEQDRKPRDKPTHIWSTYL